MNYFDTDNRKFAKEFVDYGIFSTDDTLPYKASENSAMGEYVHPLNDMKNIKLTKPKLHGMKKNRIKMTESQLSRVIKESVRSILQEMDETQNEDFLYPWQYASAWIQSPEKLKAMGYDEKGMRQGEKYYDHLLNPNWRFNTDSGYDRYDDFLSAYPNHQIMRDLDSDNERMKAADERWRKAADTRPLHRKGSMNREV